MRLPECAFTRCIAKMINRRLEIADESVKAILRQRYLCPSQAVSDTIALLVVEAISGSAALNGSGHEAPPAGRSATGTSGPHPSSPVVCYHIKPSASTAGGGMGDRDRREILRC